MTTATAPTMYVGVILEDAQTVYEGVWTSHAERCAALETTLRDTYEISQEEVPSAPTTQWGLADVLAHLNDTGRPVDVVTCEVECPLAVARAGLGVSWTDADGGRHALRVATPDRAAETVALAHREGARQVVVDGPRYRLEVGSLVRVLEVDEDVTEEVDETLESFARRVGTLVDGRVVEAWALRPAWLALVLRDLEWLREGAVCVGVGNLEW